MKGRVPEELWTEFCNTVQEAGIKTIPKKKKGNSVQDSTDGHHDKHTGQQNKTESPEINAQIHCKLIFDQDANLFSWERTVFSTNGARLPDIHMPKNEFEFPNLTQYKN